MTEQLRVEELETTKPRTRSVKIEVPEDQLQSELKKIARAVSRHVRIPGFRPGRAPYPLVEQRVGRRYLLEEYLEKNIQRLVDNALSKLDVTPAYPVEVTSVNLEPLSIEMDIPLEPEVELGDYESLRIEYEVPEVTEEDVDEVIEEILTERGTLEPVDEPAQEGDTVEATVTIQVGDETVVDEETVTLVVGEPLYLEGLSEQVVGMRAGETKDVVLPIPEDHLWRQYGDEAQVKIVVQAVKRLQLPELTLELAKELNPEVESVEELRSIVRANLEYDRRRQADFEYEEKVLQALEEQASVVFPPVLVERELDAYIERLKQYVKGLGLEFDQYLQILGKTEEQLREEHREEAEQTVRRNLILAKVLEEHQLEPEEQDFLAVLENISRQHGIKMEELIKLFNEDQNFAASVYQDALKRRAMRYLVAIARGEEPEEQSEEAAAEEAGEAQAEEAGEPVAESGEAASVESPDEAVSAENAGDSEPDDVDEKKE